MRYGHLIAAILFIIFILTLAFIVVTAPYRGGKIGVSPRPTSSNAGMVGPYYAEPTNVYVTSTAY